MILDRRGRDDIDRDRGIFWLAEEFFSRKGDGAGCLNTGDGSANQGQEKHQDYHDLSDLEQPQTTS